MKTPWQVAEDNDAYRAIREDRDSLIPWAWYCDVWDALQEVVEMLDMVESRDALLAMWDSTHNVEPKNTGDYKRAKGVVPWKEGDPKPEEVIAKGRGRTVGDADGGAG